MVRLLIQSNTHDANYKNSICSPSKVTITVWSAQNGHKSRLLTNCDFHGGLLVVSIGWIETRHYIKTWLYYR